MNTKIKRRNLILMIVKHKDGYYVISEQTKKNLGGPYKTRAEAIERLRQVEYFKSKKKARR